VLKEFSCDGVKIAVLRFDGEIDEDKFNSLLFEVEPTKKESILTHKTKKDRDNMLIGALLLNYMLKKYYDINFEDIEFFYNEYGKPYLKNADDIFFNISHSDNYIACAVCNREIGIDIEAKRKYNEKLAQRVFSAQKQKYLQKADDKDKEFTRLWTQKEAYLKMLGTGFSKSGQTLDFPMSKSFELDNAILSVIKRQKE